MQHERREFHRPARVYPVPVVRDELVVAGPPDPPEQHSGGLAQTLLPAFGSMGMLGFAVVSGNTSFLILAGVMGMVMMTTGVIGRRVQKTNAARRHAERSSRYRAVLSDQRSRLTDAAIRQRRWARSSYPSPEELWSVAVDQKRIWERRLDHGDFMTIRLGRGSIPTALRPRLGDTVDPLGEVDLELTELARRLVDDFTVLDDQPVTFDLADIGCAAVAGPPDEVLEVVRAIIAQLTVFRAPDDLRIVIAHARERMVDWSWANLMPHAAGDRGHLVTSDPDDLATILDQISRPRLEHLEQCSNLFDAQKPRAFPRVVIVLDGYHPDTTIGRMELIDHLLVKAPSIGLTFLCLVEQPASIPSAAQLTISAEQGRVGASLAIPDALRLEATADDAPLALLTQLGHVMAPLRLRARTGRASTIDSAGLFELLGITDPEAIDPDSLWVPRAAEDQLMTPIGIAEDGAPIMLDIKEPSTGGMGPHGMLIGATGSGKSELLRTLVLGLAARHEPEELAFVLVDFKGGATFAKLDRLPHSAGMITNLERDPLLIDRMLEALHGELERRQRVLHEAGGFDRADEYRAHRNAHPEAALEPLPALLVIVDEFGELLTARPEFSDLFATIGRVGRSLGVHLLLSTQRLEDGTVRTLEGHLRYRLCLRTFTPEESMAVIGSKAAAELPPIPGVGYLKVDGGVHPFKAGLVNRPLRGMDRTEMEHIVAALGGEAMTLRAARPVWLDPLPPACDLSSLPVSTSTPADADWLRIAVGQEDDPRRQRMRPMIFDFTGPRGNLAVVGAPRSGKSTLLQTLIASGALSHRPEDIQFYAIDFGGGGLHLLEEVPHVGAVLSRSHRAEISKLVRRLHKLVDDRADAFRRHRITDMSSYHALRHEGTIEDEMGEVFAVIDNWGAFTQEQPIEVVHAVSELIGSGLHHGIHVVLATPRWQDIKLAVRDHIGGRFEFRLADPIDSEIDRKAAKSTPPDVAGRGMNLEARQVHIALPRIDGKVEPSSNPSGVVDLVQAIDRRWNGHAPAAPIRVLPPVVQAADLPELDQVVWGLEEHRIGPWTVDLFGSDPHMLVFGDAESGKTNALRRLIEQLCQRRSPEDLQLAVVDYRRRLLHAVPEAHRFGTAATAESAAVIASRINADLSARVLPDDVSALHPAGPAMVLVVDDYDLVAGAAGNPLSLLVDKVAQGRDLGFHLVIARRVGGTARAAFEPLFQRVRELGSPGLILSGDAREGAMVGGVKAAVRPPGRGTWVSRGTATEVQVAICEPSPSRSERKATQVETA